MKGQRLSMKAAPPDKGRGPETLGLESMSHVPPAGSQSPADGE